MIALKPPEVATIDLKPHQRPIGQLPPIALRLQRAKSCMEEDREK
jgi:hypothetical protein